MEKNLAPSYSGLAKTLWTWADKLPSPLTVTLPKTKRKKSSAKVYRTSAWLWTLKCKNISLEDLAESVLKPKQFKFSKTLSDKKDLATNFTPLFLRAMRGEKTLDQMANLLEIKNAATYYYWEQGSRDLPLTHFLKIIHLSGGLPVFLESLGFVQDISKLGFTTLPTDFYNLCFSDPWSPTIHLALQTKMHEKSNNLSQLAQSIKISVDQLQKSLETLVQLKLVKKEGSKFIAQKGVFYVPAHLQENYKKKFYDYWGQKTNHHGFDKIDQACVSYESHEKILGWVSELREKIKEEIKTTKPETVLHMQWKVVDLFNPEKK